MDVDSEREFDFRDRILVDPSILVGKPVIKGTRIPVAMILNLVADGIPFSDIIADYPVLAEEDIRAAIRYASARLEREEFYNLATVR